MQEIRNFYVGTGINNEDTPEVTVEGSPPSPQPQEQLQCVGAQLVIITVLEEFNSTPVTARHQLMNGKKDGEGMAMVSNM